MAVSDGEMEALAVMKWLCGGAREREREMNVISEEE